MKAEKIERWRGGVDVGKGGKKMKIERVRGRIRRNYGTFAPVPVCARDSPTLADGALAGTVMNTASLVAYDSLLADAS